MATMDASYRPDSVLPLHVIKTRTRKIELLDDATRTHVHERTETRIIQLRQKENTQESMFLFHMKIVCFSSMRLSEMHSQTFITV